MNITINGEARDFDVDVRTSLLDLLRNHLGLTGTKKGCDHGQCGACTILLNGVRINSCLTLAIMHEGDDIVTVEGLAADGTLHPMQRAFVEHDAFQCGYCTPGQICSAVGMLGEFDRGYPSAATDDVAGEPAFSDEEIRERMSGNICRCGAFPNIVDAIRAASDRAPEGDPR
jgi:xanthine dehydrogenase YagT iron-sulfur-binding subunit